MYAHDAFYLHMHAHKGATPWSHNKKVLPGMSKSHQSSLWFFPSKKALCAYITSSKIQFNLIIGDALCGAADKCTNAYTRGFAAWTLFWVRRPNNERPRVLNFIYAYIHAIFKRLSVIDACPWFLSERRGVGVAVTLKKAASYTAAQLVPWLN